MIQTQKKRPQRQKALKRRPKVKEKDNNKGDIKQVEFVVGDYLGFFVHRREVKINKEKVKALLEAKTPQSKKEFQRFLGQVNYLRKLILNLAEKVKEFFELLKFPTMWEIMKK